MKALLVLLALTLSFSATAVDRRIEFANATDDDDVITVKFSPVGKNQWSEDILVNTLISPFEVVSIPVPIDSCQVDMRYEVEMIGISDLDTYTETLDICQQKRYEFAYEGSESLAGEVARPLEEVQAEATAYQKNPQRYIRVISDGEVGIEAIYFAPPGAQAWGEKRNAKPMAAQAIETFIVNERDAGCEVLVKITFTDGVEAGDKMDFCKLDNDLKVSKKVKP
jgi:hypothetical protein